MELKTFFGLALILLTTSMLVMEVASRPEHRMGVNSQRHHSSHHHVHSSSSSSNGRHRNQLHDNMRRDSLSDDSNYDSDDEPGVGKVGGRLRFNSVSTRSRARSSGRYAPRKPYNARNNDYDYDDDGGRHAYLMTTDNKKEDEQDEDQVINSAFEKHMRPHQQYYHHQQQQQTQTHHQQQKQHHHKRGSSNSNNNNNNQHHGEDDDDVSNTAAPVSPATASPAPDEEQMPEHDVYAYQLPSNLWFMVRYVNDSQGHVQKYMNIVDSFTNYLDKLEKGVRTVSVNVKGVETVFRLTAKHKAYQPQSSSVSHHDDSSS